MRRRGQVLNITREFQLVENSVEIGENLQKSATFYQTLYNTSCNSTVIHTFNRLFNIKSVESLSKRIVNSLLQSVIF